MEEAFVASPGQAEQVKKGCKVAPSITDTALERDE